MITVDLSNNPSIQCSLIFYEVIMGLICKIWVLLSRKTIKIT